MLSCSSGERVVRNSARLPTDFAASELLKRLAGRGGGTNMALSRSSATRWKCDKGHAPGAARRISTIKSKASRVPGIMSVRSEGSWETSDSFKVKVCLHLNNEMK